MLKCTKSARATLGPSQRIILRMGGFVAPLLQRYFYHDEAAHWQIEAPTHSW